MPKKWLKNGKKSQKIARKNPKPVKKCLKNGKKSKKKMKTRYKMPKKW